SKLQGDLIKGRADRAEHGRTFIVFNLAQLSHGVSIVVFQHKIKKRLPFCPNYFLSLVVKRVVCSRNFMLDISSWQPEQSVKNTWYRCAALLERFERADDLGFIEAAPAYHVLQALYRQLLLLPFTICSRFPR